jgi:predicted TIM-barrel fold metal-dependent hydrolase
MSKSREKSENPEKAGMLNLFSANLRFGRNAVSLAMFPAVSDLLAHMDRLGVQRTVAWHAGCHEANPSALNRDMVAEIERTPGAAGRIIPALAFSPVMLYEKDGLRNLLQLLRRSGTRALHFTSALWNYTFAQNEPILKALAGMKPVVFLNNNEAQAQDLLPCARRFPGISFVLTDLMWNRHYFAYDLMRQAKNILVETSLFHVEGNIELAVRHFGAERLLFGLGTKVNYGGPMAALARARISENEKQEIAHGNLERLLGLKPVQTSVALSHRSGGQFWQRLLRGERIGLPLIDAHYHLGESGGYVLEHQRLEEQVRPALRKADELGVETMLVSGLRALLDDPLAGNQQLEKALKPYGRRFRGYVVFNPFYSKELTARFKDYFSRRFFIGFKTLCSYWKVPITDARFAPMFAYAHRHGLPILNHSWVGGLDAPAMFRDLAKKYKRAKIILGHSGGTITGRHEAEELAARHKNVYLEWCGSFRAEVPWEETFRKVGNQQVVYGSDGFMHDMHWELGRLFSVDMPDSFLKPILGDNMRRILAARLSA